MSKNNFDQFAVNCKNELDVLMKRHSTLMADSPPENVAALVLVFRKEHAEFFNVKINEILSPKRREGARGG